VLPKHYTYAHFFKVIIKAFAFPCVTGRLAVGDPSNYCKSDDVPKHKFFLAETQFLRKTAIRVFRLTSGIYFVKKRRKNYSRDFLACFHLEDKSSIK